MDHDAIRDPARVAAVRASGLLDGVPEEAFDRYARLTQRALGADRAMVNVIDADREVTKAHAGGGRSRTGESLPLEASYCARVVASGRLIASERVSADERFVAHPGLDAYLGVPLRDPAGATLGTLCVVTELARAWTPEDVTTLTELAESVETEIALRRALGDAHARAVELEEAAAEIAALQDALTAAGEDWAAARATASGMAAQTTHELRTPLAAIRNLAEDLSAVAPDELNEDLRTVQRTAQEALEIVNAQLEQAREELRRPQVRVASVDAAELLEGLRGMLEPLMAPHGDVALVIEAPVGLEALRTDGLRLTQILRNLVVNAIRHTRDGEVRVTAGPSSADPGRVRFAVADTGEGIAEADHERIFRPFVRVGERERESGTGLGLPLARQLAGLLRGTLGVVSASGEGATFTLDIPLVLEVGPAPGS